MTRSQRRAKRALLTSKNGGPARARHFALGLVVVFAGWGLGNAPVHACSGLGIDTFFCGCDHDPSTPASSCCAPAPKNRKAESRDRDAGERGNGDRPAPRKSCCDSKSPTIVDVLPPATQSGLDDFPPVSMRTEHEIFAPAFERTRPQLCARGPGDRSPPPPAYLLFQRFQS